MSAFNVQATIAKTKEGEEALVIRVNLGPKARKAMRLSSTGKTYLIGTTGGYSREGDIGFSLNVTVPNPEYKNGTKAE